MNQPYIPEQDPDKGQIVTTFEVQMQTFHKLVTMDEHLKAIDESLRTLSQTLAAHVRQNIDTFQSMQDYIGEQMRYRTFRQEMEENALSQQLAQKNLELQYAEKRLRALEDEDEESDKILLEFERQRLEIEYLKKNIDVLQNVKKSTKDQISAVKAQQTSVITQRVKDTVVLTAVGTLTAASIGGVIAFVLFLIRLYLSSGS